MERLPVAHIARRRPHLARKQHHLKYRSPRPNTRQHHNRRPIAQAKSERMFFFVSFESLHFLADLDCAKSKLLFARRRVSLARCSRGARASTRQRPGEKMRRQRQIATLKCLLLQLKPFVGRVYDFDDLPRAYEEQGSAGVGKAVLDYSSVHA